MFMDKIHRDARYLVRRAAKDRGKPPIYSWDKACEEGAAYQGYGLDELLRYLLLKEAELQCNQCGAGDCTHEAARIVVSEIAATEPTVTDEEIHGKAADANGVRLKW